MQLTEQFHIPEQHHTACNRLTTLVQKHAQRLLAENYWQDTHIEALSNHTGQSYTYIRDDTYDCFTDVEEYLYSRFKRCVYHRVTQILDAHEDEYQAFNFVIDTVAERKIGRIGWKRLREQLFEQESAYIQWGIIESVVEQLNNHYDQHGQFPDCYTDLIGCPQPNGTLPYAPDKGDYQIHDITIQNGEVVFLLNAPETLSPDSHHDWTEHTVTFDIHTRFQQMTETKNLKAPTLHASEHGYTLDLPVGIPEQDHECVEGRVLSVDLGVKKQATAVVVDDDGQVAPPVFIDHDAKSKLFRVKADAEGINDRVAELRRQGKAHTERFEQLLAEYRQTRRKERRLRTQIQHSVANELVWMAVQHGCEAIVFESLGQMESPDTGGSVAWSISSWARGNLLDLVEYKAELVGVDVETVNPWGTSRYCPRCGERGETVKAPDDHTECRHGGHFHCPDCGYECDRDVVGAVNVGRKYLSESRMEEANPVAYMETGNHASFPSLQSARSTGVQSTTNEQDTASGCQTRLTQYRSTPLTVTHGESSMGGLQQNHGGNTGERSPRRSVTNHILANVIESD